MFKNVECHRKMKVGVPDNPELQIDWCDLTRTPKLKEMKPAKGMSRLECRRQPEWNEWRASWE